MKPVSFVAKSIIILFLFTCSCYSQSIGFDQLVNGQVRSDYYTTELVTVPTDYHYQTSNYAQQWYEQLIVKNGSGTEIANYSTRGDDEIPDLYVGPGFYTLELKLFELYLGAPHFTEAANCLVKIEEKYGLKAVNNFYGGDIYLDGVLVHGMGHCIKSIGEGMTVSAIDQQSNGVAYVWKESGANLSNWKKQDYGSGFITGLAGGSSRTFTYYVQYGDNGCFITSDMRRILSLQVQNEILGSNNKGNISVNDVQYSSPHTMPAIEGDRVKLSPSSYDENGMHYVFNHWEDGSTSAERYVDINSNTTYTAFYKGIPIFPEAQRKLSVSNYLRTHPVLSWTEHPNPLVTSYKIYRQILKGPNADPGSLIAEVSRGTLTYTDIDYYNNGSQYQDELFYDVDAYCSSEKTASAQSWVGIYFGIMVKQGDSLFAAQKKADPNLKYSLSNYPNPFNPSTQISYSIKEGGLVTLQVFDILGNKVADLVREFQPAGIYKVNFNAADKPSGIYICTIKANNYKETKKLLLVK